MGRVAYSAPEVTDHGSLVTLTADFDAHFVGSVARTLTLAAVSAPLPEFNALPGGPEFGAGERGFDPSKVGRELGDGRGGVLGVAEEQGGGGLPFTGYVLAAIATVGAGLGAAGAALRTKLRRHR